MLTTVIKGREGTVGQVPEQVRHFAPVLEKHLVSRRHVGQLVKLPALLENTTLIYSDEATTCALHQLFNVTGTAACVRTQSVIITTPPQHVDAVTIERAHANHTAAPIRKQGAGSGESQPKQPPLTARLWLSPPRTAARAVTLWDLERHVPPSGLIKNCTTQWLHHSSQGVSNYYAETC